MKIITKAHGVEDLVLQLRNTADRVSGTARKTMHRNADKIVELAQLQTPVDKHNLEQSIRKEVGYGARGRLEIDIVVGGFVNGVNVDHYAAEVHENYDDDNPGPNTEAKRNANPGVQIGHHYLERAVDKYRPKLQREMIEDVLRMWRLDA